MPEHRITVHPSKPLTVDNADLVIEVTSDGQRLGRLMISRGTVDWRSRNHQTSTRMGWEAFDQLMQERRE